MKTILLTVALVTIFCIFLTGFVLNINSDIKKNFNYPSTLDLERSATSVKNTNKSDTDLQKSNWYSEAMNNLSEMEYNISFNEEINSFQSPNRANNMRFIYHKKGFTVLTRDGRSEARDGIGQTSDVKNQTGDGWSIDFNLSEINRQSAEESGIKNYETGIKNSELIISGNKAFIEDENLRIDYTNDKNGMRQDFIIKNRPDGKGKLRLNLSADTKLKMTVGADALMFKDKKGNEKLKYSSLKCWDANGTVLRAYFDKNYESGIRNYELKDKSQITNHKSKIETISKFQIVVNDQDAVYPVTIDPISSSPDWTANEGYSFGFSVSTAGDVNGDGYSDVLVGQPYNGTGKVFLYYGSSTGLSVTANWSVTSTEGFGFSVSTAGDVNGDGYSDIIIGNPNYADFGIVGKAYIYYGSASGPSQNYDWGIRGPYSLYEFGYSVSTAGDVNGDGYSDILVGSPGGFTNDQDGRAFLWYGSSAGFVQDSIFSSADWTTEGGSQIGFPGAYGTSVSTAGDINGDGYSDVIVSEPGYTSNPDIGYEGKTFVFHGSASGLSTISNWSAESNIQRSHLGSSASNAGDVNGDGYSDIIIGAKNYSGGSGGGAAFIWYGSQTGLGSLGTPSNADWVLECNQDTALFGSTVSTAGDVNGDGYSDIIIGAPNYDNGQLNEGKVFAYFGSSAGPSASSDWTEEINEAGSYFGYSVSVAGDVNGDGYCDVIVGAYLNNTAHVYHGFPSGLSLTSDWTREGNQTDSEFGYSVSTAGDVNGDGYSDVFIGAKLSDNGQTDEGRVFVYYGSSSGLSTTADWSEESNQAGANFGNSVSTAGDVNGDGYADVIIGAYLFDNLHTNEGKAYVYHGSSAGLSSSSSWSTYGTQGGAKYGFSVSTAGDVNGDGYSDVIVGAPFYNNGQADEGKAFVFYGSAGGLFLSDWTTESNQAGANLGYSVSTAGDVNGDGFSDLIIGEPNFDDLSITDKGLVLVFHGSQFGLPGAPNWTQTRSQSYSGFGWSVSIAGDVNADGYSDVIIGAPYFDNSTSNSGKAFVYHGSESGLGSSTGWNAEGITANGELGYSVSTAGDVNGDGYSDVIVGVPYYDNGQTFEGRTLVYQGSPSGISSSSDWKVESNRSSANFGLSVSSAGDVNRDGYSDVIADAPGGMVNGRSYVYYGNGGTGLRSTVKQFKPSSGNIVYSGGLTGTDGSVRLNIFGRNPYGRSDGKIVYEYKRDGNPFSGSVITNSVSSSGTGSFTDLGVTGTNLNKDISGLFLDHEYKWRARVQYKLSNNPYQKYGPWKYYTNYIPVPFGCFKAQNTPIVVSPKTLNLTMFIEGFYDANSNSMIRDTARVYLRYSVSPFAIADSSKSYLTLSGTGTVTFLNSFNNIDYYIIVKQRNSIETWSATGENFSSEVLTYNFSSASSKAFGNNMMQVDGSPVKFGIYSGDVNQDGYVNLSDVILTYNDANTFVTGYKVSDVTGNNITDLSDVLLAYNNSNKFVAKISP